MTKTITKISVIERFPKCYSITYQLQCKDAGVTVIDKPITVKYEIEEDTKTTIKTKLLSAAQHLIDAYNKEKAVSVDANLDLDVIAEEVQTELKG